MASMYWYYHDRNSGKRYYTESYSMSVTAFAERVSGIVGYTVSASDISAADRQHDLDKFSNLCHI